MLCWGREFTKYGYKVYGACGPPTLSRLRLRLSLTLPHAKGVPSATLPELHACSIHKYVSHPYFHLLPIMTSLYGFVKRIYLVRLLPSNSPFAHIVFLLIHCVNLCSRSSTLPLRKRPPTHPCDLVSSARRASHLSRSFIRLKTTLMRW